MVAKHCKQFDMGNDICRIRLLHLLPFRHPEIMHKGLLEFHFSGQEIGFAHFGCQVSVLV